MVLKDPKRITLLCGGVGGAKLALGLARTLLPSQLSIIVNCGDDFWHMGLRICPDIDTVLYTLSGIVHPDRGWGLRDDTQNALRTLRERYNVDTWFQLGDADLATHLFRNQRLNEGFTLTDVVAEQAQCLGIAVKVIPMCDEPWPTVLNCEELGEVDFQTYFVKLRHQPKVHSLRYGNSENAQITTVARAAIENADILLIAPSNPWLSIAPILAVPGLLPTILARDIPRVAVSPIIAGAAVKGPAAELMEQLGYRVSAAGVAHYYGELINGFVLDQRDATQLADIHDTGRWQGVAMDTMMINTQAKIRLAREILAWIEHWS